MCAECGGGNYGSPQRGRVIKFNALRKRECGGQHSRVCGPQGFADLALTVFVIVLVVERRAVASVRQTTDRGSIRRMVFVTKMEVTGRHHQLHNQCSKREPPPQTSLVIRQHVCSNTPEIRRIAQLLKL
jgi:hypothetical protein